MITETSTITLGAAGAVIGFILLSWWRLSERFREIERSLSAHKLYAAERYATKDGLKETLDRFVAAVEGLRQDMRENFKTLGDRIERVEEHWMNRKG
ncbi:MAG: hypothetical protein ACTSU0_10405 [Alphaproteobacteria bacterium]